VLVIEERMTKARTTSPLTRNQRKKMSEVPSEVKLRKIVPEVPRDETERGELLEDLQVMGCSGFLEKPWGFKDDRIVRELLDGVSNEFDNSIRGQPVRWTEECWREVYHFSKGSGGLAGRKDKYVKECFKDLPNPKDGYSIDNCKDPRHRRLLAFLVPIVYPEKPNRITVTWDNTIFGALNGERKVNWARVITTLVVQLATQVGKSRASLICPFLYHLYERKELLRPEEEKAWKIQEGMLKYGESGSEDEAGSASGSDEEEDDEEKEEEETQVLLNRPPKRPRQEDKSEQAGATLVPKLEGPSLSSSKDRFQSICKALGEMQAEHERRGELLMEACQLAVCGPSELPERIRKMMVDQARVEDSRKLREENARLNLEVGNLLNENRAAWTQAEAAAASAERIRDFVHQAGQVVAKAELFDEKVGIGSKPSGTRIAMILTDYSEKLERVLVDMRVVVNQVSDLLRQPERQDLVASSSKGLPTLSKLSFPDNFSELPTMDELTGVEVTLESRIFRKLKEMWKPKSPEKKKPDQVMTSESKGESGSEREEVPVPDLDQRMGLEALSPDQETAGFLTPRMDK
jgi:hypothetical protein